MNRLRWFAPLAALGLAALACNTLLPPDSSASPQPLVITPTWRVTIPPRPTATPGPAPTAQPTLAAVGADLAEFRAALRPEFAADLDRFPQAARYAIDVTVVFNADGSATLAGQERVRYTNQQSFALPDLYLMLWPNDHDQYLSDMTLQNVTVNGASVAPELQENGVAARLTLPAVLAPGQRADLTAEFVINAYPGVDEEGTARFGLTRGMLLAPTFYPLIPRIVDGQWQITPPPPCYCDTTNSDTAFYLWRVTAPEGLAIVGTGTVIDSAAAGGWQTQTLVAGPMRDLALVVGPLQRSTRTVDGITLNAYLLAEHSDSAGQMLDYTEQQVKNLEAKVGAYPFAELDVVDAPGAFGGIEYPGEVFIGVVEGDPQFFEIATVHEVGHQWFYSLIGDDQILQPWLDEAAATYTEVLYYEDVYGSPGKQGILDYFRETVERSPVPDYPIGLGVADYPTPNDYADIVYQKGALFFEALRAEMGDDVFFRFLHTYFNDYRYGFASTADFQRTAEETCGCDLGALFDLWVYKGGPLPNP